MQFITSKEQRESLLWKHFLWEPSCLAFLCTNWSARMQHPQTQQIDLGAPVHLALERLQSGNLSFYLPAEGLLYLTGKSVRRSGEITTQSGANIARPSDRLTPL
jgi:hypothetical protein